MSDAAAAVAACSLASMTLLTVYMVAKHDDEFLDSTDTLWFVYVIAATAAYVCGMAMSILKTDAMFAATTVFSLGAFGLLSVWSMKKQRAKATSEDQTLLLPAFVAT